MSGFGKGNDWEKSTPQVPALVAFGRGRNAKAATEAVNQAIGNCQKFAARRTACTCVVIDENDKSVLKLPESFVARHFR